MRGYAPIFRGSSAAWWSRSRVLAGWNWWHDRLDREGVEASARYEQMTLRLLQKNDPTRAKAIAAGARQGLPGFAVRRSGAFLRSAARRRGERPAEGRCLAEEASWIARRTSSSLSWRACASPACSSRQNKPDDALATLNGKPAGAFEARFHEVRGDVLFAKGDKPGALKEYLAALAGSDARSVDTQSLQLKINDLKSADAAPAPAAAATAPANGAK